MPENMDKKHTTQQPAAIFGFNKYRREICFNQSVVLPTTFRSFLRLHFPRKTVVTSRVSAVFLG